MGNPNEDKKMNVDLICDCGNTMVSRLENMSFLDRNVEITIDHFNDHPYKLPKGMSIVTNTPVYECNRCNIVVMTKKTVIKIDRLLDAMDGDIQEPRIVPYPLYT